ncbi:hypothetical protein ETP1_046 [Edwardsiella phage ETP-1]|uniref:Uncharacterized protein n=3 Tax=Kafunavirus KF1 TaxID=1982588 RepID=A0A6G5P4F7_9CAUD|nr:hypothetical protein D877_gp48 [Edwardsiella phage KF-1]QBP07047.1 hypothetical protein ETP1_046 [Edwardsiella phage ETP-1]UIS54101.1 hypothetical protein ZHX_gp41 [Edwardsiella phage vB_EpP_ZHX]BAM63096.1 hypothetical protein [Edwardsiella phage KF-1]BAM63144.1 hypothetical protein [Edwardsiella phage IW-1]
MDNPDNAAQPSFADRVNEAVASATTDDKGNLVLPEGLPEEVVYAATLEKRRRDTQGAYTRAQQEAKRLQTENDLLAKGWEDQFARELPIDTQAELEELKATDPDAWRNRLNELEVQRRGEFGSKRQEIATKAKGETELEYRQRALQEFSEANPTVQIDNDVVQNDIPPRITRKLENGEISFGQFLEECKSFLTKGKVVKPVVDVPAGVKNLSATGGSDFPDPTKVSHAAARQYKDEIF